jgi:DNA-binding MarR family transcriptional regulator
MQLDHTLTHRLHTLHKLTDIATARAYENELGLSLGDSRCLAAIGALAGDAGSMSVNDLARHANLNKSQASRSAQSLIDQGFVSKSDNAKDGRGVALTLTRKGKTMHARCMALIKARNAEIFGVLSAQQRVVLGDLLDQVVQANQI